MGQRLPGEPQLIRRLFSALTLVVAAVVVLAIVSVVVVLVLVHVGGHSAGITTVTTP